MYYIWYMFERQTNSDEKLKKMATQKMYSNREEFERKNPYVCVETPNYQGKKCAPAQIVESYSSKKV